MSGVADRCKRHDAAGKRTERCDTIPWSQQVDEAFYENSNSSTDNIDSDLKIKCRNPFSDKDSRRPEESNNEKKRNLQKVSCNGQKLSTTDAQRDFNEADTATRSKVDSASISSESKLNRKKITWASIASQPAKPNKKNYNVMLKKKGPGMPPPPMVPGKHNMDSNAWEFSNNMTSAEASGTVPISIPVSNQESSSEDYVAPNCNRPIIIDQQYSFSRKQQPNAYSYKPKNVKTNSRIDFSQDQRFIEKHNEEEYHNTRKANMNCPIVHKESADKESAPRSICGDQNLVANDESPKSDSVDAINIVLKKLKDRNNYNPVEIDLQKAALSRFFVIKSYSEDDIHRSIKYEIWCSTDHGNKRLDEAFKERVKEGGNVMLFFSVNGSGHFCGMAQMMTSVDYNSTSSVWSQDKWKGKFKVKWIYVKDVPNSQLRHIRLENNDNKSVTNSRDTQEVPNSKGLQVLKVLHLFKHQTSIFDDFYHYEKKQEEAVHKKPTQFDNYVQQPPAPSNTCNNDVKEQNTDRVSGNFKERTMFHRGGNKNFSGNRQYDLSNDLDKDDRDRSAYFMNKDREKIKSNAAGLYRHTNSCSERSSNSKRNFNDIMHINNINYNEHNIAGENAETKMS